MSLPRSKTLISLLAEELLSHNLSKICKLNLKKFAQISLRATLFFPGKAIGGKIRPAMIFGMELVAILDFNAKTLDTSNMTSLLSPVFAVQLINAW